MSNNKKRKQVSKKVNHSKRNQLDKSVYEIIKEDNEMLYVAGEKINTTDENFMVDVKKVSKKMMRTMIKNEGVGLAHVQCDIKGRTLAMFVMEIIGFKKTITVINPKIKHKGIKKETFNEGCLSLEGQYSIKRSNKITVEYFDLAQGKVVKQKLEGLQSRIFQHEMYHLEGKTMKDIGELVDHNKEV